ncbi:MAG TPA: VanZ family protein [Terriglobales bacterium]|nr:VanZ family protein [Terriglobales bacterium]
MPLLASTPGATKIDPNRRPNVPNEIPITRRLFTALQAWLPAVAMCVVIFLLSQDSHSGRHSAEVLGWILTLLGDNTRHYRVLLDDPFRKCAHVLVYFLLGTTVYRGFALARRTFDFPAAVRSVIFCAAYAATDEFHQSLIPGRGVEFSDVLLDTAAAVLAMFILWLWLRPRHPRQAALSGAVGSHIGSPPE